MTRPVGRVGSLAAAGVVLLAACGGGAATAMPGPDSSAPAQSVAPAHSAAPPSSGPSPAPSQAAEATPSATEPCMQPATEIALGSTVNGEIVGTSQPPGERRYFCTQVPDGQSTVTFELSGLTADLFLVVGHPDLATVQQGGLFFWDSRKPGTANEVVVVEPALTDYVRPGPYYVEVAGEDFESSSPFALNVRSS